MLKATALALGAAVLHAGWNLVVKQGRDDRFLLLWGQFFLAGVMVAPIVFGFGGLPLSSWKWVALSGAVHLPYCYYLARAYNEGDFSLVYPIARGAGAMIAALGGVLFLSDHLSKISALGIVISGLGIVLLAGPVSKDARASVISALVVAVAIGAYSVSDAKGIRASGTTRYALATNIGTAISTSTFGVLTGRAKEMRRVLTAHWRQLVVVAIASTLTYALVQLAFKLAPVGYVTALRESSVVLAGYIGWRKLGEPVGRRRMTATALVLVGLLTLVFGR
jgi:drug/metabolite transporter (DMT)-like permease